MQNERWIEERFKEYFYMKYKIKDILFEGKSEYQSVKVVETEGYGRMLLNDGLVMVTERDEFIYHDMIAHVPLFAYPNPQKVLIIGGGDGGTAREVLRHKAINRCVMVEIDKMVIDACIKFIPQTSSSLSDKRLELIIEDGVKYLKNNKEKFDIIIIDSTDPIGPACPLFGEDFYETIYSSLSENGIVVAQGESAFYEKEMQKKLLGIVASKFKISTVYNFSNMTYPGGIWSFVYGSKGTHPYNGLREDKIISFDGRFRYYNSSIHRASFQLPSFMINELCEYIKL